MKSISLGTLCGGILLSSALSTAHAVAISGQGTWESTLQGRDLDGNLATFEAYYDTSLNITWLANASYANTLMNWITANTWAASLNPYGSGITGWRLPTVSPIDGTTADDESISRIGTEDRGYNVGAPGTEYAASTASEMAHLFHNTLGDKGYCDPTSSTVSSCGSPQADWGLTNTGPFSNIQSGVYWSATEFAPDTTRAWEFGFTNGYANGIEYGYETGYQSRGLKTNNHYVWAVHVGDVGASAVPVPAAAWLFGSGLLGLVGITRKCRR